MSEVAESHAWGHTLITLQARQNQRELILKTAYKVVS